MPDLRAALRADLARHRGFDAREVRDLDRMRSFVEAHADPFDRKLVPGHFTGSAFIIDGAGNLLLTHHRKLGIWVQLGGHAEAERSGAEVAWREAREESGLTQLRFHPHFVDDAGIARLFDVDIHRIPARADEPEHEHLDLRYLLLADRGEPLQRDVRESRALAWVSYARATELCDGGILRAIQKLAALD